MKKEERLLKHVTSICLALAGVTQEVRASHATFRVGKKVFVYFLNDDHSDGILSVCCKAFAGDNQALVAAEPKRFYLPDYIGAKGWVGLRLDVGKVDWEEVQQLVLGSYKLTAPKKLVKPLS